MTSKSTRNRTGRSRAGSKGGKATAAIYGREFFSEIGRLGGRSRGRNSSKGE